MGNVLIVAEYAGDTLKTAAFHAISFGKSAAQAAGGTFSILLLGKSPQKAAEQAATFGAAEVLVAEAAGLEHYLAESYAPIVTKVVKDKGFQIVAGTATNVGKDLLPRVAAQLDAGLAADVIAVLGANKFRRPMMAGNVLTEIEVVTPVVVATIRQTEFPAAQPAGGASAISKVDVGAIDTLGAQFVSIAAQKSDRPELTEAKIVVSGGRGMREGKNFEALAKIADILGGAMGASRAACDAGMVPNDLQVGQTGKVVAPNLYIAVAISGAIQHLAGMKSSKVIVAINKDAEAPIFQVADYGLVTTWEQALPVLTTELEKLKAAR